MSGGFVVEPCPSGRGLVPSLRGASWWRRLLFAVGIQLIRIAGVEVR